MKKLYSLMLLGVLTFFGAQNAWGNVKNFTQVSMFYSFNGAENNYQYYRGDHDASQTLALDTLTTSFTINKLYMMVNDDWGSEFFFYEASINYNTEIINTTDYVLNYQNRTYKSGNNYQFEKTNLGIEIASSEDPSGIYTFTHWFKATGYDGEVQHHWINNNYNNENSEHPNYKFTYTILPPAISGFAVSETGADIIGGAGTSENPYIIKYGGSLTIAVTSGSKAHTDANSSIVYKLGDRAAGADADTTITGITSDDMASFEVQCYCHNGTASLDGAKSTKTIYYKAARKYDLTMTTAKHATLFLDYAVEVPANITAYYESNYAASGNVITATFATVGTTIPASTPVIVKTSEDLVSEPKVYTFKEVADVDAKTYAFTQHFLGSTSAVAKSTITAEGKIPYVLSKQGGNLGFYLLNDGQSVAANRCYYWTTAQAEAPAINMWIEDENGATAIPFIAEGNAATETAVKFIEDGKLLIKRNGVVYDATGCVVR